MKQILSLDGTWSVIFDPDNQGQMHDYRHREKFHRHADIVQVAVPACLEEFVRDYEGVAWYGKIVTLPQSWRGKTVRIRFEAVNYRAEVWVNGEAAGAHEGGYTGFELEIGDLLTAGENFIAVRVVTPIITRDVVIDGLGRDHMPHWRGAIAGGIWQPVSLIATGAIFVADTFVSTDIATGVATLASTFQNRAMSIQTAEVEWTITPFGGEIPVASAKKTLVLNPGSTQRAETLAVDDHKLWDLDDPNLYVATITVAVNNAQSDREETRFGFCAFTAAGKHFYLNGKKLILKTAFNEAFYPHSLAYPRDVELLKKEFALIKAGNLNTIRPWRKPQPKIVYDLADELGVLFVGALPVECMGHWPQITPDTRRRIENEAIEMVKRDRNHPCIAMWEMFNEILRDGLKRLKHSVSLKVRDLDPTRLIIDEAGGFADGCSVYLPGAYEPTTINDVHNYPGAPMAQENYDHLLALGKTEAERKRLGLPLGQFTNSKIQPDLLTNISELGYGSIPDLEANFEQYKKEGNPITPDYRMHERLYRSYGSVFAETGADRVFPDFRAFVEACQAVHATGNKLMAEACRINPDIAGIGIHALNDGDWVLGAGLIDNFRNPKKPYYAIKDVFADHYIAIRPSAQNVYAGDRVQILLTSVNDREAIRGHLSLRATDGKGQTRLDIGEQIAAPHGIVDLGTYDLDAGNSAGKCAIELVFASADAPPVQNQSSIYVLDKCEVPDAPVALIDMNGALGRHVPRAMAFSPQTPVEQRVLVNLNGWNGRPDARFRELAAWVAHGGNALFLNLPPLPLLKMRERDGRMYRFVERDAILPFALVLYSAKGLWTPCSHVVKDHPFYDGLPSNCLMGQEYRDVVSRWSIVEPKSDWICGNITYDWYAGLKHKQNYLGVTAAFHGANLTQIAHGQGAYTLCTHRIVENLGKDPVADRLFSNLLR